MLRLIIMMSIGLISYLFIQKSDKSTITLKCYNDYLPATILQKFHEEYGIRVICDEDEDNAAIFNMLIGNVKHDIVNCPLHPNPLIKSAYDLGLIHPLPSEMRSLIPYRTPHALVCSNDNQILAMPWMFGSVNLVYNTQKVEQILGFIPDDPMDLIFNAEIVQQLYNAGISITILDSPLEVVYSYMLYSGIKIEEYSPEELKFVKKKLCKLEKYFNFSTLNYVAALQNESTDIVLGWSDLLHTGINGNPNYVLYKPPQYIIWIDGFIIPRKSGKDYKKSELFLTFLARPDNLAELIAFRKLDKCINIERARYNTKYNLDNYFDMHRFWLGLKMKKQYY